MAFEYGSDQLGIKNPFKFEGSIEGVRGLLTTALGTSLLLGVSDLTQRTESNVGWIVAVVGFMFLMSGLTTLTIGLMKVLRFFVGRSVPASLSKNLSKSEQSSQDEKAGYNPQELEQMLMGRKNLTFTEPHDLLSHFIHTLVPGLIFMPYPFRNLAMRVAQATAYTLVAFVAFGLAWFSGVSGLTTITTTPVLDYMGLVLLAMLVLVWLQQQNPLTLNLSEHVNGISIGKIALIMVLSISAPVGLVYFHANVQALPSIDNFSVAKYVIIFISLAVMTSILLMALLAFRAKKNNATTEVSEFRDNWQRSVHPQELFIHFESIIMANRRYKEIANRIYRDFDANLIEEGGQNKGKFDGEMISETQPVFVDFKWSRIFKGLRLGVTILGQLMLMTAILAVYMQVQNLSEMTGMNTESIQTVLTALIVPLMLWIFGKIIAKGVHAFWAEMQFESSLFYFRSNGTYSESRVSTGSAIHDSTRSENTVVRSSITPWIIVSRILTSTFAGTGSRNLENVRHIMTLQKDDVILEDIKNELDTFFNSRENIAGVNRTDLDASMQIHQMNEATRAIPVAQDQQAIETEEAAGYIRNEAEKEPT